MNNDPGLWLPEGSITEWRGTRRITRTLYYLISMAVGIGAFIFGADHVVTPTHTLSRGPAFIFIFVGLGFLAIGSGSLFKPVKTITLDEGGDLTFTSWRRELRVHPGELVSVRAATPLDWNRLLPWKVTTRQGTILIWPTFRHMIKLWRAFAVHSPSAEIDGLSTWRSWD